MTETLPSISSANGPSSEADVRGKRQELQAIAAPMAFPIKLPINENSIDYSDQIKEDSIEKKIDTAKKANKQSISEKQSASLEKARASKAEKARLAKLEKNNIGDVINKLIPFLDDKFAKVNRRFDDLQLVIAHEGALQQNQIPPTSIKPSFDSIAHPETKIIRRGEEQEIPIQERYQQYVYKKRQRPEDEYDMRELEEDNRLYKRRNTAQFHHTQFETPQTESRAANNEEMGHRAGLQPTSQNLGGGSSGRKFLLF